MSLKIRIRDQTIVEKSINLGFGKIYLVRLNRVRNILKVLYVSDITKINWEKVKNSIYNSKLIHLQRANMFEERNTPQKEISNYEQ